jgi:ATP-dependent DNA helicase RecG
MTTDLEVAAALTRPPTEIGQTLAETPEGQWFDRKSIRVQPRALAEAEVAFANAEGGVIVVGISNGQVEGTDARPERVNELMQAAVDFTVPPVRARSRRVACINQLGRADQLLVIEVDPSEGVHATASDQVFLRIGDENRKLSFAQRQELIYDKGQAHFDGTPVKDVGLDALDAEVLGDYARAINCRDSARALQARGLMTRRGEMTAAAYLRDR